MLEKLINFFNYKCSVLKYKKPCSYLKKFYKLKYGRIHKTF